MYFVWRGSPGEWMAFAWSLKAQHGAFAPERPAWNDTVGFHTPFRMDDEVLVEPDIGERPAISRRLAATLCRICPHVRWLCLWATTFGAHVPLQVIASRTASRRLPPQIC